MGAHCTHTHTHTRSHVLCPVCVSRASPASHLQRRASVGAGVEVLYITLKRAHYSLFFKVHTRLSRRARLPGQPPGAPPRARAAARRVRPPRARAKPKPLRGSRARAHMHGGARARCARETVTQVPSHCHTAAHQAPRWALYVQCIVLSRGKLVTRHPRLPPPRRPPRERPPSWALWGRARHSAAARR